MHKKRSRRQKAIVRRRIFLTAASLVLIGAIALLALGINALVKIGDKKTDASSDTAIYSENESSEVIPDTFATVMSTGDVMVHSPQLNGAKTASGDYDFSAFFKETAPYFKSADLAVANLEVTFGGTESGKYNGYPVFNTPDSLADAIKASGLNFLVTSNNHSYDTGIFGLKRTVQVLKQRGIEYTGTRETPEEPKFAVKEINGIKIGIADFTYETSGSEAGRKYLNGARIRKEANDLINSFSYDRLDAFYSEVELIISEMKTAGADFTVFYMHWGNEYKLAENTHQKAIAQELSNLGVNMIIGSHPHVIEPIELIRPEGGEGYTVCLYSTGNYVSNQRKEVMSSCPTGHTEDGMLFSFTLKKNGDGTVISDIDLIPTWVNKYKGGSGYLYTVYPLENANDGSAKYKFNTAAAQNAAKSYERTKKIVAEGLTECQNAVGCEITFK